MKDLLTYIRQLFSFDSSSPLLFTQIHFWVFFLIVYLFFTLIAGRKPKTRADGSMDPTRRVIRNVEGVDWLYHEATYDDSLRLKAHKRHHSTALEAATVAREAGVRHLILGHYSKRYLDETILLDEARTVFPDVRLANEGLVIDLNQL